MDHLRIIFQKKTGRIFAIIPSFSYFFHTLNAELGCIVCMYTRLRVVYTNECVLIDQSSCSAIKGAFFEA